MVLSLRGMATRFELRGGGRKKQGPTFPVEHSGGLCELPQESGKEGLLTEKESSVARRVWQRSRLVRK